MAWRDVETARELEVDGRQVRVRWPALDTWLTGNQELGWKTGVIVRTEGIGRGGISSFRITFPDGGFLALPLPLKSLQINL
jgi:hypothetical protein